MPKRKRRFKGSTSSNTRAALWRSTKPVHVKNAAEAEAVVVAAAEEVAAAVVVMEAVAVVVVDAAGAIKQTHRVTRRNDRA